MSHLTANQKSISTATSAGNGKEARPSGNFGLVIDTSIVGVAVAVVALDSTAQPLLWQAVHETTAGSLQQIAALVAKGCSVAGLTPRSLAAITMSTGPGSFTGIKVGLAFGYGMAAAAQGGRLQLRADSGLAAAARSLQDEHAQGRPVLLFLPATRTHGFVAKLAADGSEELALVHVEAGSPVGPARRATELVSAEDSPMVAVAGNWPLLLERLGEAGHTQIQPLTAAEAAHRALERLAARAALAWPSGYSTELPAPRYLRLSTAEEKLAEDHRAQVKSL